MALHNWNKNSSYNSDTKKINNILHNTKGGCDISTAISVIVAILILLGITGLFDSKCIKSGCNNSPANGSSLCYYHKSTAGKSTKSYSGSSSTKKSKTNSSYSSGSSNTNKPAITKSPSSTYKGNSSRKKEKKYDMYDVYDYSDAEDFYEDNSDDFDSYEDAEDYYDEAWD